MHKRPLASGQVGPTCRTVARQAYYVVHTVHAGAGPILTADAVRQCMLKLSTPTAADQVLGSIAASCGGNSSGGDGSGGTAAGSVPCSIVRSLASAEMTVVQDLEASQQFDATDLWPLLFLLSARALPHCRYGRANPRCLEASRYLQLLLALQRPLSQPCWH